MKVSFTDQRTKFSLVFMKNFMIMMIVVVFIILKHNEYVNSICILVLSQNFDV